jgi:hypothetical protein
LGAEQDQKPNHRREPQSEPSRRDASSPTNRRLGVLGGCLAEEALLYSRSTLSWAMRGRNCTNEASKPEESSSKDGHWKWNSEEEDANKRSSSERHKRTALECALANSDNSLNDDCENGSL